MSILRIKKRNRINKLFKIAVLIIFVFIVLVPIHHSMREHENRKIENAQNSIQLLLKYSRSLKQDCKIIVYEQNDLKCEQYSGVYTVFNYMKMYNLTANNEFFNIASHTLFCLENSNFSVIENECLKNFTYDRILYELGWALSGYYYYNALNKSAGSKYERLIENLKFDTLRSSYHESDKLLFLQIKIRELRVLEQQTLNNYKFNKTYNISLEYERIMNEYVYLDKFIELEHFYIKPQWMRGVCSILKNSNAIFTYTDIEGNVIKEELKKSVNLKISEILRDQHSQGYFNKKFLSTANDVDSVIYTYQAVLALDECGDLNDTNKNLKSKINQSVRRGLLYLLNEQDERGGIIEPYETPHKTESLNGEILMLSIKYFDIGSAK